MENCEIKAIVDHVYAALKEKGYRPLDQIIGYILTEDPTYITNYNGARHLITKIDRYDLLREILLYYFCKQSSKKGQMGVRTFTWT